jgi:hypothetical protein
MCARTLGVHPLAALEASPVLSDTSPFKPYLTVVSLAVGSVLLAVALAVHLGHPVKDPDGVAGPAWVRLPGIVLLFLLADIVPRAVLRARQTGGGLRGRVRDVARERWPVSRLFVVAVGLASFYASYVAYRNLKSFLPFLREGVRDEALLDLDRTMSFGYDPSTLLHDLLGTGVSAHVLSFVYVAFLAFVPLSLAAALVWTRNLLTGALYVTALSMDWLLGAASYYLVPSLGPVFAAPELFADLPATGVSRLQESLWNTRLDVLADPVGANGIHGIAGFASLHVAIVLTGCLVARRVGLPAIITRTMWLFFALTVVSTLYFGWHYIVDDIAGALIGWVTVVIAAKVTGHARVEPAADRELEPSTS